MTLRRFVLGATDVSVRGRGPLGVLARAILNSMFLFVGGTDPRRKRRVPTADAGVFARLEETFDDNPDNFDSDEDCSRLRRGVSLAFLRRFVVLVLDSQRFAPLALCALHDLASWPFLCLPGLVGNLSNWRRLEPGNPLRSLRSIRFFRIGWAIRPSLKVQALAKKCGEFSLPVHD